MLPTTSPQDRDRWIDLLRALAVLIVVLGHWAAVSVVEEAGRLTGLNALTDIPESHPATWLLQVMPLLFFVGGFSNARSLALHDGRYLSFVRTRLIRLLVPTVVLVGMWSFVGVAAEAMPLGDPNALEGIADIAGLPFWFLGVYVIVVTLAPWLWSLHRRFGWRVIGFFAVGAVLVDVAVHGLGMEVVGVLNFAMVWLLPHQLGFFHADGRLDRVRGSRAAAWALGGLGALVLLVTVGGYPVSMIAVPGADRFNTNPPSLALVALTVWLIGLVLLTRPAFTGWAERHPDPVRRVNRVPLTLYLWHVSAAAVAAVILDGLGFPRPEVGSVEWWLWRVPWMLAVVPIMLAMVLAFRRFEIHPRPMRVAVPEQRTRHLGIGFGVVSVALGLFGFGVTGFDNITTEFGGNVIIFSTNPLQGLLHVGVGLAVLALVYRPGVFAPVIGAVAAVYVGVGVAGWSDGIAWLAMNPEGAVLHVTLGGLVLALLAAAMAADRSRAQEAQTPTT